MAVPYSNRPVVCPTLIGRTHDLAALHLLVREAKDCKGCVALVCGEAGIGKSRMVAEVKTYAASQGFLLLQGNCFPTDSSFPYAPLRDLLRTYLITSPFTTKIDLEPYVHDLSKLLPDLPLLLPHLVVWPSQAKLSEPEQEKRGIFTTLTHFLMQQALQQPVLCIIEDLHWCDDITLEFLLAVVRRCMRQPILFILTYRSDEVRPALSHVLAQLSRERLAQEFPLSPLSHEDIYAMLQAIFDLPRPVLTDAHDVLYVLTEGNPFFVEEILKSLVTNGEIFYTEGTWKRKMQQELSIPQSIQDAVQQRIDRLGVMAKRVLILAAVAGCRFDFVLLQRIMNCNEEQLLVQIKELIAAQLVIEESAERFAFRHALTQQAIYGDLLARERRALHRTIAETIEGLYSSLQDTQVADLAYHFYKAGDWIKALAYGQRAGEKALALFAPHAAVEHLTRALDAAQRQGTGATAQLYLMRGKAYDTLGEFEHAQSDYEYALEEIHTTGDAVMEWQCMMDFGFLWAGRDYAQAGVWFRHALDLARKLNDLTLHARSLNYVGNWLVNIGHPEEGLREHQGALGLFEQQKDRHGMAETLDLMAMGNLLYGDIVHAAKLYSRAIPLLRVVGDNKILSSALTTSAACSSPAFVETTFSTLTPQSVCIQQVAEALQLARQSDWVTGQAFAEMDRGWAHIAFGEFGEALAHLQQALHIATEIKHQQWLAGTLCVLTQLHYNLLQPDLAIQHAEEGMLLARQLGSIWWSHNIAAYHALSYLAKNELSQAESVLTLAMPRAEQPCHLAARRVAWVWGRLALAQREPETALRIAEQLIASAPNATNVPVTQPIPHLLTLKGEALLMLQRVDEASEALHNAKRGAQERQDPSLLWNIHGVLGRLEQVRKHEDMAQHEFSAAREVIKLLATKITVEALRTHFLQTALKSLPKEKTLTPRRAEAERFGGLTERERNIAVLIAQGKSNRDIASALIVSERTVETHISNIFFKLGFSSRTQIAAWTIAKGL